MADPKAKTRVKILGMVREALGESELESTIGNTVGKNLHVCGRLVLMKLPEEPLQIGKPYQVKRPENHFYPTGRTIGCDLLDEEKQSLPLGEVIVTNDGPYLDTGNKTVTYEFVSLEER